MEAATATGDQYSGSEVVGTRTRADALLFPAEAVVLACGLGAVALYWIIGIESRDAWELYRTRLIQSLRYYVVGLPIALCVMRLNDIHCAWRRRQRLPLRITAGRFRTLYLTPEQLLIDARLLHLTAVMFVVFINLKHLVPLVTDRLYDQLLLDSERMLLGGATAGAWLRATLGNDVAPLLSAAYRAFYSFTALSIFFFVLQRDRLLAHRFFTAFALMWLAGILTVYLFPTLGPCFFAPELSAALPWTDVTAMQADLWRHKTFLDGDPFGNRGVYLISGLPSLHLAVPLLATVALRRRHRLLAGGSFLFACVTALTTLYFDWHYLWDDAASCILVFAVWQTALRIGKRDEER